MKPLLDAFWRAAAYCLHPQVIALSILPVLLSSALVVGLGYFYWDAAVAAVRGTLESFSLVDAALTWAENMAGMQLRVALAPMLLLALALPLMVMLTVLLVAALATPAVVRLVGARRFAGLERKRGGGVLSSVFRSAGYTVADARCEVNSGFEFKGEFVVDLPRDLGLHGELKTKPLVFTASVSAGWWSSPRAIDPYTILPGTSLKKF